MKLNEIDMETISTKTAFSENKSLSFNIGVDSNFQWSLDEKNGELIEKKNEIFDEIIKLL